ncbi:type I restriction endonuclease subunit R [Dyadobacter psychrotolerans]|uniref:Type I restriction enzyme endonuclease subunit n=1 Tax=Dyadobacter psychrotolerans TaxID=2541721 RepID=A0A4R5E1T5_9BACT|nr:type I restriction endonuclease subunit R [Dyadobacter psychrotolerans]TDE18065.1 type I restriction endonuclease subunit R [Dyadobacter psychrotolerans]
MLESNIEDFTIQELQNLGYQYVNGTKLSPGGEQPERSDFSEVILSERLRSAIQKLNPTLPAFACEQALREVQRIASPDTLANNELFHTLLVEKVKVPYQEDGYDRSYEVALIDFEHPLENDFLAVNQFTITDRNTRYHGKRPDVVLFVNGIPLVVIELKNATDEQATVEKAYKQIQTYKSLLPALFTYNAFCVISDGLECKAGSLSASLSRYMAWKSVDGEKEASRFKPQLETLIKGMLNPVTLLDLVQNFIVFEKSKKEDPKTGVIQVQTVKKLAAYHQYYAVNKAVESTIIAAGKNGNRKGGVVWHTQGSGKSLSMAFYTGKLVQRLNNPTVVIITDRNDLDDQLFDTFASCQQLLRQDPVQAENREKLKELLRVASGGIVFATIQKFVPDGGKIIYDELSDRKNIVVIADEAHRTQYGFEAKTIAVKDKETKEQIGTRIAYGFAKYLRDALPKATYIGFTGTPVESTDINTPAIFGQYVDIYDISQAIEDGATVRIYYESRLAKINISEEGKQLIAAFDKELDENEEISETQKAKARWSQLEAIVGDPKRIKNVARDLVDHFEKRQEVFTGKAMIVAMSRRIAVDLYNEIIKLRPDWHDEDLSKGSIKVVMTAASSDGEVLAKMHTTKTERKYLADRMKEPTDPLKLVIVRDMWLTGFDAPSLHTLYVDKLMRGHNLMQAIARVNRVFGDKPGGLVVDYLGIATDLKKALSFYSDAGGKGNPADTQEKAVEAMLEKLETVRHQFQEKSESYGILIAEEPEAYYQNAAGSGFNVKRFYKASHQEKLSIILQAEEHILGLKDGKNRFIKQVGLLSQAFALSIPHDSANAIKEEVAFFQAVKARLNKFSGDSNENGKSNEEIESTIRQIVDQALVSDQVVDIFEAAGIDKPDLSILSEEFLMEIKDMKHQNLALELLKKILMDEIKIRSRTNLVQGKALLEMLEGSIRRYQNNLLSTSEIIQFLIDEVAKKTRELSNRGGGLTDDEWAFYDALAESSSAKDVLGDDMLRSIAVEVAQKIKANATIDWTIRESARAKIMVVVRRILNKYGYPPDKQQRAIDTVLKQAAVTADWVVGQMQD